MTQRRGDGGQGRGGRPLSRDSEGPRENFISFSMVQSHYLPLELNNISTLRSPYSQNARVTTVIEYNINLQNLMERY